MDSDYLQKSLDVSASFLPPFSELRGADDSRFHRHPRLTSCPTSLPAGSLRSAALSAADVGPFLSCPGGCDTRGTKRKCTDDWDDPATEVDLDLSGKDGDMEDDVEDDGTYFPQRAPPGWAPRHDVDSPEPATKKLRPTLLGTEKPEYSWEIVAMGWEVAGRSDETMEYDGMMRSCSRDVSLAAGTTHSNGHSLSDYDVSSSDSSSESSDSESDSSSSSEEESDSSDDSDSGDVSDDDDDDVSCPAACPCRRLSSPELPRIERQKEVLQPLLHKFLKYRTMKTSNCLYYDCCERVCSATWPRVWSWQLAEDYDISDLQVEHYSWGTWKQPEEEEPECPSSCVCNTGRSTLRVAEKMKRKKGFRVLPPLYQRVLQRQLLREENRLCHMCCENRCALYHLGEDRAEAARQIKKDYHKSDLGVIHYVWGSWKPNGVVGKGDRRSWP